MKNLIKIFISFLFIILNTVTYANQIDFYGEKDFSWDISKTNNISKLNNELKEFYKKTGLNTDIIVLGKGDDCYLENNFDSCVQKYHNYNSDLIIVLSMKSDIKNKGDIRSLIKDEFKEVIPPSSLLDIQDKIIPFFKEANFSGGMTSYLKYLSKYIDNKCIEIGLESSCNSVILAKKYHSFIAEKEYEKKYNIMMKTIYYILFIILIIISYILIKKFYIKSINNLYKDLKYRIGNISDYEMFDDDKKEISIKLGGLSKILKNKLGDLNKNAFYLRKFYKTNKEEFSKIIKDLNKKSESFKNKENLKKKVDTLKKIDL